MRSCVIGPHWEEEERCSWFADEFFESLGVLLEICGVSAVDFFEAKLSALAAEVFLGLKRLVQSVAKLGSVEFGMGEGAKFAVNAVGAAHPGEMPAAVFDASAFPVAHVAAGAPVAPVNHPRAVPGVAFAHAVEKEEVVLLLENADKGMPFFEEVAEGTVNGTLFEEGVPGVRRGASPERKSARGFAERVGARNFVGIGEQDDIVGLARSERATGAASLETFEEGRIVDFGHVFDDDVDEFVAEGTEGMLVFGEVERLGFSANSAGGFDEHKLVNDRRQLVQAELEQFQLVEKDECVIDHEAKFRNSPGA